jgi:O-antigen/teichoic acid export membrane protein
VRNSTNIEILAAGTTTTLSGRLGGRALGIIGQILVARFLGPTSYGLFSIGSTLLNIAGIGLPFGLDRGIIQFGGSEWPQNPREFGKYLSESMLIVLVIGIIFSLAVFLLAPWLSIEVFHSAELIRVLKWLSPAFTFLPIVRVLAAATRVTKRMKYGTLSEDILPPLVFVILFIFFYILGFGLDGAILALSISYFVGVVVVAIFIYRLFPGSIHMLTARIEHISNLIRFSIPVSMASVFSILIVWLNRLMVGCFRPEQDVGQYQASSQISLIFAIILSATSAIFTPLIVDLFKRGKINDINELFKISTKWSLYLSIPFFLVIILVPREIMRIFFGPDFEAGSQVLLVLTVGQLINVSSGSVGQVLIMTGHHLVWMRLSMIMLISSIIISALLTPVVGLTGPAIATSSGIGGLFIVGLLFSRIRLGIWPYDMRYVKGIISSGISLAALVLTRKLIDPHSAYHLLIYGLVAGFVMVVSLVALKLDDEDYIFFRATIGFIRSRIRMV